MLAGLWGIDEIKDLLFAANSRQFLPELRPFEDCGEVIFDQPGKSGKPQERPYSNQRALNRTFVFIASRQGPQIALDKRRLYLPQLTDPAGSGNSVVPDRTGFARSPVLRRESLGLAISKKAYQIPAISQDGVFSQTRLNSKILQKVLNMLS
jgi:hypothetical protein